MTKKEMQDTIDKAKKNYKGGTTTLLDEVSPSRDKNSRFHFSDGVRSAQREMAHRGNLHGKQTPYGLSKQSKFLEKQFAVHRAQRKERLTNTR